VATLGFGVFASTAAKFGVSNVTGILAVEQNIFQFLLLQVRALQDILEIILGESYSFY
jgi:hypothetical protein